MRTLHLSDQDKEEVLKILQEDDSPEAVDTIYLSRNNLDKTPDILTKFLNIDTLFLNSNPLKEVGGVCNLQRIKMLFIDDCELESLSQSFGSLTNLMCFNASDNKIRCLPQSFSLLTNLEVLSLDKNLLTSVPSFSNLLKLERFMVFLIYDFFFLLIGFV